VKRQQSSWLSLSLNTWQASLEAQQVIGLRLAKLVSGGNQATNEASRMTFEKLYTFWEAQTGATIAALTGKSSLIPSRTFALYRRKDARQSQAVIAETQQDPAGSPRKKSRVLRSTTATATISVQWTT
jgi:hypothetical protein